MTSELNKKNKNRYRVGRSKIGLGLFATNTFKKGEKIIEYVGRKISTKEADDAPGENRYLFEISKKFTVDGSPRWNIARYANHSCTPNAETDVIKGRIYIMAIKRINPGEEITYDYGEEYLDEYIKNGKCMCETEKCKRGGRKNS